MAQSVFWQWVLERRNKASTSVVFEALAVRRSVSSGSFVNVPVFPERDTRHIAQRLQSSPLRKSMPSSPRGRTDHTGRRWPPHGAMGRPIIRTATCVDEPQKSKRRTAKTARPRKVSGLLPSPLGRTHCYFVAQRLNREASNLSLLDQGNDLGEHVFAPTLGDTKTESARLGLIVPDDPGASSLRHTARSPVIMLSSTIEEGTSTTFSVDLNLSPQRRTSTMSPSSP